MNAKWSLLLLLVIVSAVIFCFHKALQVKEGKIICTNGEFFDWGIVDEGSTLDHDFIIKNGGNSDLIIEKIKTGCGCTMAIISKEKLAPNETAILGVEYKARKISNRENIAIWVKTNDKTEPVKEFIMTGLVKIAVSCRPKSLSFDFSDEGDVSAQILYFQTNVGEIELLKCSSPESLILEWNRKEGGYMCTVKPKSEFNGLANQKVKVDFKVDGKVINIIVPVYILEGGESRTLGIPKDL